MKNGYVQTGSGAHPASYTMGIKFSIPGGKAAECEADHLPPSSAEVSNVWSYTSTTPIRLREAWCLDKAQGHLYLYPP
jgi:hypothetical protein